MLSMVSVIGHVAKKEFRQIARDRRTLILLLALTISWILAAPATAEMRNAFVPDMEHFARLGPRGDL